MAEIVACPSCQRKLQVPEQYLGHSVQCPECRHTFTAAAMATNAPPAPRPSPPAAPKNDDRRRDAYDDDDRRSRRGRYGDDEDDYLDYGVGRRRYRDDYAPHRGGLILALGLVALIGGFVCGLPIVVGPIAWIMGNADLREIRAGRMDAAGEGMTRSGQVCGIIATIFMALGVLFVCLAIVADRH